MANCVLLTVLSECGWKERFFTCFRLNFERFEEKKKPRELSNQKNVRVQNTFFALGQTWGRLAHVRTQIHFAQYLQCIHINSRQNYQITSLLRHFCSTTVIFAVQAYAHEPGVVSTYARANKIAAARTQAYRKANSSSSQFVWSRGFRLGCFVDTCFHCLWKLSSSF